MADQKISQLTAAATPLAGTEVLPIVQSGATVKVSIANITAGRDVTGKIITATDNFVVGTAGKGIDFSVDSSAAGMTSELLNDYEEGTWTPVPTSVTVNSGTPVWTGYYCKIGRVVTAQWTMTGGSVSVTTSSYITLPFVASSTFRPWGPWGIPSTNSSQGGMVAFGSDLYFNTAQTFSVGSGTITYQV